MVSNHRKTKITSKLVESLNKGDVISDTHLPGYFVRCQQKAKIYFVRKYANRQRHYITIGEHAVLGLTEKKARMKAQEIITTINQGASPTNERTRKKNTPSINDYAEHFFSEYGKKLKPTTLRDYKSIHRTHLMKTKLGQLKLDELSRNYLASLHSKMHLKKRTANKVLQLLSSIYREAANSGLINEGYNPTKGIKHYKIEARQNFLSEQELEKIGLALNEAEENGSENLYSIAAIRLLIFTGARLNEILSLRWSWVDLERGFLNLPDSKTGRKVIHLSLPAIDLLTKLPRIKNNPFVIVGTKPGTHWVNLRKPWERIKLNAGIQANTLPDGKIQHIRIHDIRHSFAALAASNGVSLPIIGALLGHKQAATTHRYAHLANDPLKKANDEIGMRAATALMTKI